MAIYHLHIDSYRRSRGCTAIGGLSYRRGLKASCPVSGRRFNFRAKAEAVFSEFIPAQNDPTDYSQLSNLLQIYEAIERFEKHPRATLGREIEAALPHELTLPQQVELVRSFVAEVRQRFGAERAFFDFSIHAKDNNAHAHICMSEREQIAPFVFEKTKRRDWDGEEFVRVCREVWQTQTNSALEKIGNGQRVDCRSHADRGLRLLPSFHEGKAAYFNSEVKTMNDTIKKKNQELQAANDEWQARIERAKIIRKQDALLQEATPCEMVCVASQHPVHFTPEMGMFLEWQYEALFEAVGLTTSDVFVSYINERATVLFDDGGSVVDYGDRVKSIDATPEIGALRLIQLALIKNWGAVSFSGNEAFLRAVFLRAMESGLNIVPADEWQMNLLQALRTKTPPASATVMTPAHNVVPLVPRIPTLEEIGAKLKKAGSNSSAPAPTKKRRHGI